MRIILERFSYDRIFCRRDRPGGVTTEPRMTELHPRLAADTGALGETELCWLRWMRDARFPWLIVVPKRDGLREWHHLPAAARQHYLRKNFFV